MLKPVRNALGDEWNKVADELEAILRKIKELKEALSKMSCEPPKENRRLKAASLLVAGATLAVAGIVAATGALAHDSRPQTPAASVSQAPTDQARPTPADGPQATPTSLVASTPSPTPQPQAPRVVRNETPIPVGSGVAGSAYRAYNPIPQVAQQPVTESGGHSTDGASSSSSSSSTRGTSSQTSTSYVSSGSNGTPGSDGSTVSNPGSSSSEQTPPPSETTTTMPLG
jgi:hypothetical protein